MSPQSVSKPTDLNEATTGSDENIHSEWKSLNPDDMSIGAKYGLCISSVVPRPVGVITSISSKEGNGVLNCAPFSYTSMSSHDPPIVTHGLCLSRGKKKDTLMNIEATGEWVFNILTTSYLEKANSCSALLPPEVNELDEFGLTPLDCDCITPPRIAEAPVAMECKLFDKKEIFNDKGEHTTTIVMGKVLRFHLKRSILRDDRPEDEPLVALEKLHAVGRAGDITFWPVGVQPENFVKMPRPK